MLNKRNILCKQLVLSLVIALMGMAMTTPVNASVCLLGDYDNPSCEEQMQYQPMEVINTFCNDPSAVEVNSSEYNNLINSGYTCTAAKECPEKASCVAPSCSAYTHIGSGEDHSNEYTVRNGTYCSISGECTINKATASKYSDWPSSYRTSGGKNDVANYACYVCMVKNQKGVDVHAKKDNKYYWRCENVTICKDGNDTAYSLIGKSRAEVKAQQEKECEYKNTVQTITHWSFVTGESSDEDNYLCGHCKASDACPQGYEPETTPMTSPECYDKCGEGNSEFSGHYTVLADGTEVKCCKFGLKNTHCYCNEEATAIYDRDKPKNTGCNGFVWDDKESTEAKRLYGDTWEEVSTGCQCIKRPCAEGDIITDENKPNGPNAQGYYTVKRNGVCYAKKFTGWNGDTACYKDMEMNEENGFGCEGDLEFDTENCECAPKKCPEGYSTDYQSVADCTKNNHPQGWNFSSNGKSGDLLCGKCEAKTCTTTTGYDYYCQPEPKHEEPDPSKGEEDTTDDKWVNDEVPTGDDIVYNIKCVVQCQDGYPRSTTEECACESGCPEGFSTAFQSVEDCGESGNLGWVYTSNGMYRDQACGMCTAKKCTGMDKDIKCQPTQFCDANSDYCPYKENNNDNPEYDGDTPKYSANNKTCNEWISKTCEEGYEYDKGTCECVIAKCVPGDGRFGHGCCEDTDCGATSEFPTYCFKIQSTDGTSAKSCRECSSESDIEGFTNNMQKLIQKCTLLDAIDIPATSTVQKCQIDVLGRWIVNYKYPKDGIEEAREGRMFVDIDENGYVRYTQEKEDGLSKYNTSNRKRCRNGELVGYTNKDHTLMPDINRYADELNDDCPDGQVKNYNDCINKGLAYTYSGQTEFGSYCYSCREK